MSYINEEFPLDLFLSGDPKAGRLFFEKYGGLIRNAVLKIRINSDAVKHDDVFNGAIVHLFDNDKKVLRVFKGGCTLSSYIFKVSYNYALSIANKENGLTGKFDKTPIDELDSIGNEKWMLHNSDVAPVEELLAEIFGEISIDVKMIEALRKAFKMLPQKDQNFLDMIFVYKRPTEEIMIEYELNSPNSVYSKKNKLLSKLKKLIRKILE